MTANIFNFKPEVSEEERRAVLETFEHLRAKYACMIKATAETDAAFISLVLGMLNLAITQNPQLAPWIRRHMEMPNGELVPIRNFCLDVAALTLMGFSGPGAPFVLQDPAQPLPAGGALH